jgi:hypothetical protein
VPPEHRHRQITALDLSWFSTLRKTARTRDGGHRLTAKRSLKKGIWSYSAKRLIGKILNGDVDAVFGPCQAKFQTGKTSLHQENQT